MDDAPRQFLAEGIRRRRTVQSQGSDPAGLLDFDDAHAMTPEWMVVGSPDHKLGIAT